MGSNQQQYLQIKTHGFGNKKYWTSISHACTGFCWSGQSAICLFPICSSANFEAKYVPSQSMSSKSDSNLPKFRIYIFLFNDIHIQDIEKSYIYEKFRIYISINIYINSCRTHKHHLSWHVIGSQDDPRIASGHSEGWNPVVHFKNPHGYDGYPLVN